MTSPVLSVERLLSASAAAGPVLGIETGGRIASLGVVAHGRIQAVLARAMPSHCAGLPAAVDEVLDAGGLKLRDLAGVAVGIGPGSFTGLRIGLSYAKGVTSALGIGLTGVSSLDAIALCIGREMPTAAAGVTICSLIDARRDEVYAALYRFADDALERVTGDLAVSVTELVTLLSDGAGAAPQVILAGDAKGQEVGVAAEARGCRVGIVTGPAELSLRGSLVAALGAGRIAQSETDNSATLEPVYVRSADASIKAAVKSEGRSLWNAGMKS